MDRLTCHCECDFHLVAEKLIEEMLKVRSMAKNVICIDLLSLI
jgi:hypothetical protein